MSDIQHIQFIPMGLHQQLDSASLSVATTIWPSTVSGSGGANKIIIQAQTQNVRYGLSSSAPTSVQGFQLKAGDPPVLVPLDAGGTVIKVIAETAGAVLDYQLGR